MDLNQNIYRNEWHQIPVRARNDWYLGLDVGQSIDPSAVCVLEHVVTAHDEWLPDEKSHIWKQQKTERFFVRHLERLPLQTPYPRQVQHVANMLSRPPLDKGCTFALDYTGCGRPVADMFASAGLRPNNILITAGSEVTRNGGTTWHVPKQVLVSAVEARLHSGELKIAAALTEAGALQDELKDFSRKVSEAGRVTFSARSGKHDDLVLSICIALFMACNRMSAGCEELRI
jgi:hypothetical protein